MCSSDLTSIAERVEACGLQVKGFTDQHHFITGILSELPRDDLSEDTKTTRALQTLLHPEMLGRSFQVLALAKDATAAGTAATTEARVEEKATTVDSKKIWQAVLAKIPAQKAFVRNSASAAHVLGLEGRNFKLGFPPGDKAAMDILGTQANRKFVETLLHEITGNDWTLKLTVNEELVSKNTAVAEDSSSDDFKNEPLIQEAIELFNARVRS